VGGTDLGSRPMAGFGISIFEHSGFAAILLYERQR
jgi:hypothetical protein